MDAEYRVLMALLKGNGWTVKLKDKTLDRTYLARGKDRVLVHRDEAGKVRVLVLKEGDR